MTAWQNELEALDRQIEAILHVPISQKALARRTRQRGLLVALPVALTIGAITLGDFKTEGLLSALGLSEQNAGHRRVASSISMSAPDPRASAVKEHAADDIVSHIRGESLASTSELEPTSLQRLTKRRPSKPQSETRSPPETVVQNAYTKQEMAAPAATRKETRSLEKLDAVGPLAPNLETQSRLATLDAIRDLRLK